jgi:pantothenate kinase type III
MCRRRAPSIIAHDKNSFLVLLSVSRTAAISPFDETKTSREAHLSEFLPGKIFEKIFGTQAGPNDVEITAQFATRQVSMLPVYVVSTNDKELPALIDLLKPLPVRIFLMQAEDFGREIYPGIGVDRVAALHAAEKLYGKPSLVIDGGTALTWTTTDPQTGGIRGGISPGLSMRFRALHEFTGKLPFISQTALTKRLNRCIAEEIPLPFYAGTTMDAIISSACREVTLFLAYVMRECTTESKRLPQTAGDAKKHGVAVCLTGGSAQLLRKLLSSPDHSGLLPQGGRGMEVPGDATVEVRHSLVHDGLAYLLLGKTPPRKDLTKEETVRNFCIGQRVIVRNKSDGLVRGSILGVDRAEQVLDDVFLVKLEDYSMERFDVTQICGT